MAHYDVPFPPKNPPQHTHITTSFSINPRKLSSLWNRKEPNALEKTHGSMVQPGKILSKQDRETRRASTRIDSVAEIPPKKTWREQQEKERSFGHLFEQIQLDCLIDNLGESLRVNLAPEAAANSVQHAGWKLGVLNIRVAIVSLIAFLIIFGTAHTLVNYLLFAIRASAQCNGSTVFFPVTYTYTTSIMVPPTASTLSFADSPLDTSGSAPPMITHTETSTTYETSTLTVTATATLPEAASSSTLPYMFSGDSTTTSWLNGNSPSSGASLVTATTTVPIYPSDPSSSGSTITLHSTLTNLITVTPPVYSSTMFSLSGPETTSTTHITRTKTISSLTTITRSSFSGVGSSGWNMTGSSTPAMAQSSAGAVSSGTPTTATVTYYWTTGDQTYSTSTTTLTTTLYTLMPSATTISLSRTTITQSFPQITQTSSGIGIPFSDTGAQTSSLISVGTATASSGLPEQSSGSPVATSPSLTGTGASKRPPLSTSPPFAANSSSSSGLSPISANPLGSAPNGPSGASSFLTGSKTTVRPSYTNSGSPIGSANSTIPTGTGTGSQGSMPDLPNTTQSSPVSSLAGATGPTKPVASGTTPHASTSAVASSSPTQGNGYNDPSMSTGLTTTASASPTTSNMSSISPSTDALSSLGSSFANGPGSTHSFNTISSAASSTQASSSLESSFEHGSASASSYNTSATAMPTRKASATPSTSTRSASSSTSPSASPIPSVCGEHGDFTLDFDDLPSFTPSNSNGTDITQAPPIFSPYHHLTFSDGYVHAPPPDAPYQTQSGKQMAVFLGNASGNGSTEDSAMSAHSSSGRIQPGEISDGAYDSSSAYWFNPHTAWLGCDNAGPAPCTFKVTGWTWDPTTNQEIPAYSTQYKLPPCPSLKNCQLSEVAFPPSFQGLTGLQIQSFVGTEQRMFFMDDLAMGWYNNTCAAGLQRQGGPGSFGGGPGHSGAGAGRVRSVRRFLR